MATGLIDSSGRFNLATGGSARVAPGKYQVAISVVRLLPRTEDVEQGTELITPAKYASLHESGLHADVTPGENRFSFDLNSSARDEIASSPESPPEMPESEGTQPAEADN